MVISDQRSLQTAGESAQPHRSLPFLVDVLLSALRETERAAGTKQSSPALNQLYLFDPPPPSPPLPSQVLVDGWYLPDREGEGPALAPSLVE